MESRLTEFLPMEYIKYLPLLLFTIVMIVFTIRMSKETQKDSSLVIIHGTIEVDKSEFLPDKAVLHISLESVSEGEGETIIIAKTGYNLTTPPPYSFNLEMSHHHLLQNHRYAIRIIVEKRGKKILSQVSYYSGKTDLLAKPLNFLLGK